MLIPSPSFPGTDLPHITTVQLTTFCHNGSWKVVPLCEQWLPFFPNRLTFSTSKHTKQICYKKWYDIIEVSAWVPLTNFTQHAVTCQSTPYGMNLDWASCLNEPKMFCFAYGYQTRGRKRCHLHLFSLRACAISQASKHSRVYLLFCPKDNF